MRSETVYEFRRDIGACLLFTLAFWILSLIFIDLMRFSNVGEFLMASLHIIVCAVIGVMLHVEKNQKCVYAQGVSDTSQQNRVILKLPLTLKWILAIGLSIGIRYIMAPKGTVYILATLFSGWYDSPVLRHGGSW